MRLENRVRERRLDRGWTQEELAKAAGVSRQTIVAIEKGGYEPSVRLALELAEALGGSADELFWLVGTKGKKA
jgi:putative transcriptional regulator